MSAQAVTLDGEFACCVPYAAAPFGESVATGRPMRDWTEISIRPVLEVRCPQHGVLGHAVRADEARKIRDTHWDDLHATRNSATP